MYVVYRINRYYIYIDCQLFCFENKIFNQIDFVFKIYKRLDNRGNSFKGIYLESHRKKQKGWKVNFSIQEWNSEVTREMLLTIF